MVNALNLSGKTRTVGGSIDLKTLDLDPTTKYASPDGLGTVENGRYKVSVEMPPWSAQEREFRKVARTQDAINR